jgi:uncharacterized repeat protein (TIGR01451 family)
MGIKKYWCIGIVLAAGGLLALAMIVLGYWAARAAGPWYVSPGGDDGNDCLSSGAACATINGVLNKPGFVTGDTILVATGTYTGAGNEVVLLDKSATLTGGWDGTFTVQSGTSTVDGEGARRGITVNSGVTAVVERFTVQNGHSWSYPGGGIYAYQGILTLTSSIVIDNTTYDDGGGIYIYGGALSLIDSTVSGNKASDNGGGIDNFVGTLRLVNSTVSGNTANDDGGGVYGEGTTSLYNSTVYGNMAYEDGGGLYGTGTVVLKNSLLASTTASSGPDCFGTTGSSGYNLIEDASGCTFTPITGDLTDVDADLGPLIGAPGLPRYHPLLSGSPTIDAGDPAGCTDHLGNPLVTDQRGAARVGRCDIGAYEYTSPGPAASIYVFGGTHQRTPPFTAFRLPLQAAVLDSIGSPVSDTIVTFSAPDSGPSGTFTDSGSFTTIAITAEGGVAAAATFTANGLQGSYTVTATSSGVTSSAEFLLSNIGWYVTPSGDDSGDCLSPGAACATINGALSKAGFVAGDTILVATGTYTSAGSTEVVLLDKDAVLSGGWDGTFAAQSGTSTVDGEGIRRGIAVNSGVTAVVERFTVQNGAGSTYPYEGGGILNRGALTLNNSTISHNSAIYSSSGGGIYTFAALTLNNCTVSSNTASSGGGIFAYGGVSIVVLNNSTVSGNTASANGGGVRLMGHSVTLQNSILAGNTASSAPDCSGIIDSAGYNLVGNTSGCTFTPAVGDLTNIDPQLGPLTGAADASRYHPLLPGSPAIDVGDPAGCTDHLGNPLETDQRGLPRFGRCDIGAYEIQPLAFSTKTAESSHAPAGKSLRYTIVLTNGGATDITNVCVTDTLPISLTYVSGSLTATSGSYGQASGVITWTGAVDAGQFVTITFQATVTQSAELFDHIVNSAVISGGGETITCTATVDIAAFVYLPVMLRNH